MRLFALLVAGRRSPVSPIAWIRLCVASLAIGLTASSAHAVPSYARQTGSECAACHVGAYGPQLTPYGVAFKIGGYTDSNDEGTKIPLSAMLVANFTHTAKDAAPEDTLPHYSSNNNAAIQEVSLFLAGRFTDNIGSFIQGTYSGVDRKAFLDQVDIRYAQATRLWDKDATFGVAFNTNPTVTDPLNTLGQWRFPYITSDFNVGFGPSPMVESLAGNVVGLNPYLFFDKSIYAEFGIYNTISQSATSNLMNVDYVGKFKGVGTYWRLAYMKDMKKDNFSVGLIGFNSSIQPDPNDLGTPNKYRDLGLDASYQFLGNREHVWTLAASFIREWQTLDYTQGVVGEAANSKNTLNQFRLSGSYHYDQTWGGTIGYFSSRGSQDELLYNNSLNGRPNTSGYILQADWTPWGKENSWGAPWANLKVGIQYTGYSQYMGGSSYLDGGGNERQAKDNNTTMLFLWTAI